MQSYLQFLGGKKYAFSFKHHTFANAAPSARNSSHSIYCHCILQDFSQAACSKKPSFFYTASLSTPYYVTSSYRLHFCTPPLDYELLKDKHCHVHSFHLLSMYCVPKPKQIRCFTYTAPPWKQLSRQIFLFSLYRLRGAGSKSHCWKLRKQNSYPSPLAPGQCSFHGRTPAPTTNTGVSFILYP